MNFSVAMIDPNTTSVEDYFLQWCPLFKVVQLSVLLILSIKICLLELVHFWAGSQKPFSHVLKLSMIDLWWEKIDFDTKFLESESICSGVMVNTFWTKGLFKIYLFIKTGLGKFSLVLNEGMIYSCILLNCSIYQTLLFVIKVSTLYSMCYLVHEQFNFLG